MYSRKQYAKNFLNLFGKDICLSLKNVQLRLEKDDNENYSLFPFLNNFSNIFYQGDYEYLAHFVYYFNELELIWLMSDENLSKDECFKTLFSSGKNSIYNLNNLKLDEILLSSNTKDEHIILFLFLLCLPEIEEDSLMFNDKKEYLLESPYITEHIFEDLLLIAKLSNEEYLKKQIKSEKNLSIKIIENFLNEIFLGMSTVSVNDFKNVFPEKKIKILMNMDCYPDAILLSVNKSLIFMYEEILLWVEDYSRKEFQKTIETTIIKSNIKNKVIKY